MTGTDSSPDFVHEADLELTQRAARGEPEAVDALGVRLECVPRLLATANRRRMLPLAHGEIGDLAQDTIVRVWSKLSTFDGHASIEAWVWQFGVHELNNRIRRHARRRQPLPLEPHLVADVAADPSDSDALYEPEEVRTAIAFLPDDLVQVVQLKHDAQKKFREIAVDLAVSENTAKSRYYRALRLLRDALRRGDDRGEKA